MVQVQLDLAEAGPAEFGQSVEMLGIVLLDREEERVAGRPPVAVAKIREPHRIVVHPPLDPLAGHLEGNAASPRLEMIDDADQDMDRLARTGRPPTGLEQIGYDPAVHAALADRPSDIYEHQDGQGQSERPDHQSLTEVSPVSSFLQQVERYYRSRK